MMRLHVVTLGCQMSVADGEELASPLTGRGFTSVAKPDMADAIVLNTCTVRRHAEDKALSFIGRLRDWKDKDPQRVLIVAGCAAERLGPWIQKRFPYVDLVVGAKSIEDYPRIVEEALGARFDALAETHRAFAGEPERFVPQTGRSSRVCACVTIMRGCNYSCSYCIVPAVRGRELYRPLETVLAETRAKVALGAKEITLLGQTVNSWHASGRQGQVFFPELLTRLGTLEGLERIRFESPHPHFVNDALIEAMATTPNVCEQLHLPVQSGSDRLLRIMRRNYDSAGIIEKTARLRRALPLVEVSTDIIVGFPSETDEDFERTLDLVRSLRPSWSYTFKYSPRDGTESAAMDDDVQAPVKEERLRRLNALCDALTEDALAARVGKIVEVLDEGGGFGRTRDGFKVSWNGSGRAGQTVKVRVTATSKRILKGEKMSEHKKSGAERRKHRRFNVVEGMVEPITLVLEGADNVMHEQPAIMTDLSAGGISLLMFVEPPHAKSFQMTLAIPGLEGSPIEAAIVRVHQKGSTYSVGLTFKKISRTAQKTIEKMAEDSADCQTRTSLGLPDACGRDCPFHSLFSGKPKTSHTAKLTS